MASGSGSPGLTGSFTSLNNTLNAFASSTSAAAPPDAWAYSPAYDLAPHINLNSPYSTSFGGPSNNGSAYSYATMLPQHDTSLFSTGNLPTGNPMRIHQDYMTSNNSPPPTLNRGDYQTMVTAHSPSTHMAGSMSEDEHQQNKQQLDYVGGLSPADKYQHEQTDYSHQSQQEQKTEYVMHNSPPGGRQVIKDQVLVKSEPTSQQSYVQLPPFLN